MANVEMSQVGKTPRPASSVFEDAKGSTCATFMATKLLEYQADNLQDESLWLMYQDDFDKWTIDNFEECPKRTLFQFRDVLRQRGVWVGKLPGSPVAHSLHRIAHEEIQTEWTKEEIQKYFDGGERFISNKISHYMLINGIPFPPNLPPQTQTSPSLKSQPLSRHATPPYQSMPGPSHEETPSPIPLLPQTQGPSDDVGNLPPNQFPTASQPAPTIHRPTIPVHHFDALPAMPVQTPEAKEWYEKGLRDALRRSEPLNPDGLRNALTTQLQGNYGPTDTGEGLRNGYNDGNGYGFGNCLSTLEIIYKDEYKYGGRKDIFDLKVGIFHEMCMKANVPPTAKCAAYSTMLKGSALDHYYTDLRHRAQTVPFETLCGVTKKYFEGREYQRGLINRWNNITLQTVMGKTENSGKTTTECLQLLLTEMRHLKLGLPAPLQMDVVFHSKLIQACQDFPACVYACCKPADDISELIEDLESSITTLECQQKRDTSTPFTDRRYYRQAPNYSQTPFRRPPYQDNPPRRMTPRRPSDTNTPPGRICLICRKQGCWSSKHSKEERDDFRRKNRSKGDDRGNPQQFINRY